MFKHILLPIDGSELSLRAASIGVELAGRLARSVYASMWSPLVAPSPTCRRRAGRPPNTPREPAPTPNATWPRCDQRAKRRGVECKSSYEIESRP